MLSSKYTATVPRTATLDDVMSEAWLTRVQQIFRLIGTDVTPDAQFPDRLWFRKPCCKCGHGVYEDYVDRREGEDHTLKHVRAFRENFKGRVECAACRRTILRFTPPSKQAAHAAGLTSGGKRRKTSKTSKPAEGKRKMTFPLAVQVAAAYGFYLARAGRGYEACPLSGGDIHPFRTLSDALEWMQQEARHAAHV
jgi:hypothetical protein